MANTLYKATVRELEAVLPPRVVSQSLQEGLTAAGKNADTLAYGDAENILKNRVLPRLTLSLGAERAEKARQEILERLAELPDESQLPVLDLGAQGRALRELQAALKPFNIYFDWSETQKLRAQLAQLETEHKAERNAGALVAAAQAQLGALDKKLDDELSEQARDLNVLEAALESSAALKSPKVRRLGLLIELVRSTQAARKLAPAEVERAHKLAGDLSAELERLAGDQARARHHPRPHPRHVQLRRDQDRRPGRPGLASKAHPGNRTPGWDAHRSRRVRSPPPHRGDGRGAGSLGTSLSTSTLG